MRSLAASTANQNQKFADLLPAGTTGNKTPAPPSPSLFTQFSNYFHTAFSQEVSQAGRSLLQVLLNLQSEGNVTLTAPQVQTVQSAVRLATSSFPHLAGIVTNVFRTPGFTSDLRDRLSRRLEREDRNNPISNNAGRVIT